MSPATAFALTLAVASPEGEPARPGSGVPTSSAREAADTYLRHLYALQLVVRSCTEASRTFGKEQFRPDVSLDESRRAMRSVDEAARQAGLDVDALWAQVGPIATATAEAIKADTPVNADRCARVGSIFRVTLANLQGVLRTFGITRSLIEKDF